MTGNVPWWEPQAFAARRQRLHRRAAITRAVRDWFHHAGFVEVETPALQVSPGLEPHLKPFQATLVDGHPDDRAVRYLHTSPEFAMKKLLVAGEPRIFQLARVFRNGERSATHHPEFTMLEWYRAGGTLDDLIEDCRQIVTLAATTGGDGSLSWNGRTADATAPWTVARVADLVAQRTGIDLAATLAPDGAPDLEALVDAAARVGISAHSGDRWDDVFFRVFLERIEPDLGVGAPAAATHYPAPMAALARLSPDDPRYAERFELFVCGLELANAFAELTDPDEQASRFAEDQALRTRIYGDSVPVDPDFLEALRCGMPESAGIALGFDRLVMLATGADDIAETLWSPVARARQA